MIEIGTLVAVWRDNGEFFITTTRSEVDKDQNPMRGGVVWVHGIGSSYAMTHVRPIIGKNIHPSAVQALKKELACSDSEPKGEFLSIRTDSPKPEGW